MSDTQRILDVVVKTAPASEPVTLADMTDAGTNYSRIDFAADDTLITNLLQSAREWAEKFTGRAFITQTRIAYISNYNRIIHLPYAPIDVTSTAIIVKRKFQDESTTLTLDSDYYVMGITSQPSDLFLNVTDIGNVATGKYPADRFLANHHLEVEYVCGYGTSTDVPMPIREAIMKIAATSYETRNDMAQSAAGMPLTTVPQDAKNLLWPYRMASVLI